MKKKFGFTLIEMLIAITVFAIGVLAVLRVLTGNLSIMDHTDMKLQSTILGKEGLELLYNLRDSNLEKKLQWNCVLNPVVYGLVGNDWDDPLNNFTEDQICIGFFGIDDKILQLGFSKDNYYYQNLVDYADDFDNLFEMNKLCMFTGDIGQNTGMSWYSYCLEDSGESTFFARYISFTGVNLSGYNGEISVLPEDKILKVESHVLYKKGHKTGDLVFESFIGNY